MTTRQAWSASQVFAKSIGLPPGGPSLTAEAAWRVVMIVRMYEEAAEILWRQAQIQSVVGGSSAEGFDAVARAFRKYRETATPWLEGMREKDEQELREHVQELSRTFQVVVSEAPPEVQEELRRRILG